MTDERDRLTCTAESDAGTKSAGFGEMSDPSAARGSCLHSSAENGANAADAAGSADTAEAVNSTDSANLKKSADSADTASSADSADALRSGTVANRLDTSDTDDPEEDGADGGAFTCTVPDRLDGARADSAVAALTGMSRSAAARLCAQGNVTSGGKALSKKDSVRANHSVTVILPPIASCEAEPEDIPLDVIYEDSDIIVINKPSGMVVHPAPGHYSGTLVSALLYRCGSELSGIGGVARPGIVHRIDRQTTGLIAAAKNDFAHERLSAQLADHSMSREYRALVVGHMKEMCGTVDAPIARSTRDRKKMAIAADGRSARTHYRVDEEFPQCSLLTLNLETGRTHQIRVHMAYLGHPVLGDPVYGGDGAAFVKKHPSLFDGQMLHAQSLTLTHPRTGEKMTFHAPLPDNFERALSILRKMQQPIG